MPDGWRRRGYLSLLIAGFAQSGQWAFVHAARAAIAAVEADEALLLTGAEAHLAAAWAEGFAQHRPRDLVLCQARGGGVDGAGGGAQGRVVDLAAPGIQEGQHHVNRYYANYHHYFGLRMPFVIQVQAA
jgi:hypothetical protein